ncbi:MAG: major facilitator superfamily 1, partial [Acidobacteria bacterium]|nr:major facilitator superfamily 1 [Acidobacteriota bacterium]
MTTEEKQNADRSWIVPFLATLFAMMTLQMSSLGFSPLLPAIQNEFSMSYTQIGLFTGMYGLLALALSVPAGLAAKRFGEKHVLILALFLVGFGLFMLGRAPGFYAAFAARALWIGAYRFAFVCVLTAIALTSPPSLKGSSMGFLGCVSSLASVIGAPFGSKIGEDFGWRTGMTAFACTAILGALAIWAFYNPRSGERGRAQMHSADSSQDGGRSAFRTPIVWALSALVAMVGVASFSVTFFVPAAATTVFKMDAVGASFVISTGYICAIFLNLLFGYLMDHYNKWIVLSSLVVLLIPASLAMTSENELVFRIATAVVLAGGFTATNQVYGLAGSVLRGRETGNVMGMLGLGAGISGYVGPQMLGVLRDRTNGFSAGWYMMAGIALVTLIELWLLKRHSEKKQT